MTTLAPPAAAPGAASRALVHERIAVTAGYLLQFVEPRVITEDTMRHGLVV